METKKILAKFCSDGNADYTNRLIPGDDNFDYPEWAEYGTLDGVPVVIYYRTTPEDQDEVEENGGDWGLVDWEERIDRITVDLTGCDRAETPGEEIDLVCSKYKIDKE